MALISWKSGWKTYAVVAVGVVLGGAQAFGIQIPDWVNFVLGFLGLGALRHGVQTQTATVIENILQSLSQPGTTPIVPNPVAQAMMQAANAAPTSQSANLSRLRDGTA